MGPQDITRHIHTLRNLTSRLPDDADGSSAPVADEDSFLGLGVVSTRDARRAALNLLEDAIVARRAEEREALGRERAERTARDSEEFFRRALQAAPIPAVIHAADGRLLQVSPAWRELAGYGPPEVDDLGDWVRRACGDDAAAIERRIRALFEGPQKSWQAEVDITTADGDRRRWLLSWSATDHTHDTPPYAVGLALDITERSRAEAALRDSEERLQQDHRVLEQRVAQRTQELARANAALQSELTERLAANAQIKSLVQRLVSIQEEDRRSIARDIHDHVGQQLTALRLAVELMLAPTRSDETRLRDARRVMRLTQELDRAVDFLTWQLRPPTVDNLPLEASLLQLAADWSERFGFDIEFAEPHGEPLQLRPEVHAHVYRIVQEALHNTYKHASASSARVTVSRGPTTAVVVVADSGVGFDATRVALPSAQGHLGLVGMRERATLIGARLTIDASPGIGTTITLDVPLAAALGGS